jgi:chloramphenicol O-acetyltransferase type A
VDCTKAYYTSRELETSFFLYYLYQSLAAANETEPFRYRIEGDDVIVYDRVNASPTINRQDGTFGFAYMDYEPTFEAFVAKAKAEVDRVQNSRGLVPAMTSENVIHYSSIPWINFTSLSHARAYSYKDSIPKISFGQMTEVNGNRVMPVSIHAHHALMDGYHVSQFIERFQHNLNQSVA